ncbi:MAG: Fic family protein [Ruminiclostridium sp.]|nr:Fic family protein [Ruminiclostridium sp.]
MNYITVAQAAEKWGISERRVRDYCANGRVTGARITGNKWVLPETAEQPERKNSGKIIRPLTDALSEAVMTGISNSVYEYVKVNFTYHSVATDGISVTLKQVQKGFADRKFNLLLPDINTDDTLTAANHFLCIDKVIEEYRKPLSVDMVRELHSALGIMTERYQKNTRSYDGYRTFDCKVGNRKATAPERIYKELPALIEQYESKEIITLEDILDFHYRFERIRPFAENNGLIGRLLIFKECLRNSITPFIIDISDRQRYFDGLDKWERDRRELIDLCLDAQVNFSGFIKI